MKRSPVFPIPGDGQFVRQPLFAQDLCRILDCLLDRRPSGAIYDITGPHRIAYVDMIKLIRRTQGIRRPLVHVPVPVFRALLQLYAIVSRNSTLHP